MRKFQIQIDEAQRQLLFDAVHAAMLARATPHGFDGPDFDAHEEMAGMLGSLASTTEPADALHDFTA